AGLQHAQKPDLSFSLAESTGGVDGHVSVEALANSGHGRERRADFKGDAREDQLLAPGRSDCLRHLGIVGRVHRRPIDDWNARQAARSKWVQQEVRWWLANRPISKLFIILTDGDAQWDDAANDFDWSCTSALPAELRGRFKQEPHYVDLRWAKGQEKLWVHHPQFRDAVLDIGAPLLGKPKDELDGEDVRRYRNARRLAAGVTATLAMLLLISIIASWRFFEERRIALHNESIALSNESISLAALSDIALKQDQPVDSVQLALAAWPRKGDQKRPQMRRVIDALVSALSTHHERVRLEGHDDSVRSAAFSPNGERILTA